MPSPFGLPLMAVITAMSPSISFVIILENNNHFFPSFLILTVGRFGDRHSEEH